MDEGKLFDLLGQIVKTNQAVIEQGEKIIAQNDRFLENNERLMAFVQERDALVPERNRLEVERLQCDLVIARESADEAKRQLAAYGELGIDLQRLSTESVGLRFMQHKTAMLNAKSDAEYAETRARQLEERRAKQNLPAAGENDSEG